MNRSPGNQRKLHKHIHRLERVWLENPIYFVTTTTMDRRSVLASEAMHEICREVWKIGEQRQGWLVGSYILMPDHLHFMCAPNSDAQPLSVFVGKWKEWTAKFATRRCGLKPPLWQEQFFDHLVRSSESNSEKVEYMKSNPVRAGLVARSEDWAFQGEMTESMYD